MLNTSSETDIERKPMKLKMIANLAKMSIKKKNDINSGDSSLDKKLDRYLNQGSQLTNEEIKKIEEVRAQ